MHTLTLIILLIVGHQGGSQMTASIEQRKGQKKGFLQWSDHYDFAIQLPGRESQCYWHFARKDGRFYLTYMVQWVSGVIADRRAAVSILSPKGVQLNFVDETKSQMSFQVKELGFYQMCFSNNHNRFGEMRVFLNFGVYYGENAEVQNENETEIELLNSTISSMQDISNKIRLRVQHMWRFYNVARMQRGTDYYMLQSKSNYVYTWSILQSLLIVTSGYFQLFVLKRFFRTQKDRPRC